MFNWLKSTASKSDLFRTADHGGVTVVEPYGPEIRHPESASDFRDDVLRLVEQDGRKAILIDLRHVKYFSSTGFASLLGLGERIKAAGGVLKLCNIHPDVAIGANIIGLGRIIETFPSEHEAIESF